MCAPLDNPQTLHEVGDEHRSVHTISATPISSYVRSVAREAEARRAAIQRSLVADSEALAALVEGMRTDKALVESTLGAALRRRVMVSGDVNALLSA